MTNTGVYITDIENNELIQLTKQSGSFLDRGGVRTEPPDSCRLRKLIRKYKMPRKSMVDVSTGEFVLPYSRSV
jgi:hypothetical protein